MRFAHNGKTRGIFLGIRSDMGRIFLDDPGLFSGDQEKSLTGESMDMVRGFNWVSMNKQRSLKATAPGGASGFARMCATKEAHGSSRRRLRCELPLRGGQERGSCSRLDSKSSKSRCRLVTNRDRVMYRAGLGDPKDVEQFAAGPL